VADVLVTGITGQLGFAVASELIRRGDRVVGVLRSLDESRRSRLTARMEEHLGGHSWNARDSLELLPGDVTVDGFWNDSVYRRWLERLDVVIHCAGAIRFENRFLTDLFRANIDGTRNAASLVRASSRAKMIHASTAFVCGKRLGLIGEDDAAVRLDFNNYYEVSKYYAEQQLVAAFGARSDRLLIVRPSVLCGRYSDGSGCEDQGVAALIELLKRLNGVLGPKLARFGPLQGDPDARTNCVPLDLAARAIVDLKDCEAAWGRIVHVAVPSPITNQAFLDVACDTFGFERLAFSLTATTDLGPWHETYGPYVCQSRSFDVEKLVHLIGPHHDVFTFDPMEHFRRICRHLGAQSVEDNRRRGARLGPRGRAQRDPLLRPEERLALTLLRDEEPPDAPYGSFDWPYFFSAANAQKVSSLIWWRLSQGRATHLADYLPRGVVDRFKSRAQYDQRQDRDHVELAELVTTISQPLSAEPVFLKGLILKHTIYPAPWLRRMGDVDILVRERDLETIQQFLEMSGFRMQNPLCASLEDQLRYYYELPSFVDNKGRELDVHWHYVGPRSPFYRDIDPFLQDGEPVSVGRLAVRAPGTEYFFLHMLLHLYTTAKLYPTLRDLYDIAHVVRRGVQRPLDVERFVDLVTRWDLAEPVYYGTALAAYAMACDQTRDLADRFVHMVSSRTREDVRKVLDHFHLFMRPGGRTYMAKLEAAYFAFVGSAGAGVLGRDFSGLLRHVLAITPDDFQALYYEPINDPVDVAFMYLLHPLRLLQYYYLSFGDDFRRVIQSVLRDKLRSS